MREVPFIYRQLQRVLEGQISRGHVMGRSLDAQYSLENRLSSVLFLRRDTLPQHSPRKGRWGSAKRPWVSTPVTLLFNLQNCITQPVVWDQWVPLWTSTLASAVPQVANSALCARSCHSLWSFAGLASRKEKEAETPRIHSAKSFTAKPRGWLAALPY